MYQGKTINELAEQIKRESASKRDYLVDTRELVMLNGVELRLPEDIGEHSIAPIAHRQIGSRLGIPAKYYDRLQAEAPSLLDANVNYWFQSKPERRLLRTFTNHGLWDSHMVRAFLSDRYRRRDNDEVAEAVLPILGEIPDVQFVSSELTDTRLYIKAVAPRVEGEVSRGDVVQAGVVIRNSEVGHGALVVQPLVFRLVCLNGMIVGNALRSFHVGRSLEGDEEYGVFRDETMRLDDQAFFAKLADVVRAAVDETRFQTIIQQLRDASEDTPVTHPVKAVERLASMFTLSDGEGESVLTHLAGGGDLSRYGVINAITRASQDSTDYERASELEEIGGRLLDIDSSAWHSITA